MEQTRTPPGNHEISGRRGKRMRHKKAGSKEQKITSGMTEDLCPEAIATQLNAYCAMFEYFGWHAPLALLSAARDELLNLSCRRQENNAANAP